MKNWLLIFGLLCVTSVSRGEDSAPRPIQPVIAELNRAWRDGLSAAKLPPAAAADDAEFVRRVYLDLTGRIPTVRQAREFLDNPSADKREKLVDALLSSPAFGQHIGFSWRLWLDPPEDGGKPKPDILTPWLAQQFQRNRSWGEIVRDLLTAEGEIRGNAAAVFLMANSELSRPKPEMIADSVSRIFMGVELRCAQCHDHPFADWKQYEFWGVAAFFGRLHPSSFKGGPNVSLLESDMPPEIPGMEVMTKEKGPLILVPAMSGPQSGKTVQARFPKGELFGVEQPLPYRRNFTDWLLAAENPYFAPATVNRFWFLLFGRGFVNPLEGFDPKNPAANPEMLAVLAREFAASDFDCQHLLRCICLSEPYQRTSRREDDQPNEDPLMARMAVKALTPEMIYDSLAIALLPEPPDKSKFGKPNGDKPMVKPNEKPKEQLKEKPIAKPVVQPTSMEKPAAKPEGAKPGSSDAKPRPAGSLAFPRDEFVKAFRARGGNLHASNQGILQTLRLLNDPAILSETPIIDKLVRDEAPTAVVIETLVLATYARRPTAAEMTLLTTFLQEEKDPRQAATSLLWILLNSTEFLVNH